MEHQQKGKRKTWSKEAMLAAVNVVKKKEMGYLKASKEFNVPKSTLKDYVKNTEKPPEDLVNLKLGRKPVLPQQLENELVQYCLEMDKRFYGLTSTDVRRIAFQLALRNGLSHPFSPHKGQAGKKWLRKFIKRNPQLTFRKPQGISSARVKGFTKENVKIFFDILEPAMEKIQYNPSRVYNVDETGLTNVQSKHSRVISLKGKRQVGAITAAERGSLVTMVTCMNASGGFVPPMLVFPRKNMKQELLDGAPPGTIAGCHPSGWIQQHLFTQWLNHFIKHTKPTLDDPILLVLDGHYSHTRNLDVIELARKNNVIIICLPPHSTHKMQPLDLSFMAPFKTYYSQEIECWLKNHVGRVVNVYQIGELLGKAYLKSATAEISANGFRKSGIYPCNRHIFQDYEFAIHRQRENTPPRTPPEVLPQTPQNATPADANIPHVSPEDITPLPSCSHAKPKDGPNRKSRKGSAKLVTGTPYKNELEESMAAAESRKNSVKKKIPVMKASTANGKTKKNTSGQKRKVQIDEESDSSLDESLKLDDDSDMDCSDENDTECMICEGVFSEDKKGEKWIRCVKCYKWGHEECVDARKKKSFVCDFCLQG